MTRTCPGTHLRALAICLAAGTLTGCAGGLSGGRDNARIATADAPLAPAAASRSASSAPASMPTGLLLRRPGGFYTDDGPDGKPPVDLNLVADAEPKPEPLNARANDPYTVFGRDYVPARAVGAYKRQGTASWYGRKFHGQRTVGGEIYDMYAMSAAHPTLPIPSYARVTNLENGRAVIVRINDRGPFSSGRIMDLSYAAAFRLGFAESALTNIEVETIVPVESAVALAITRETTPLSADLPKEEPSVPQTSEAGGIYLQLGAFSVRVNADNFRARLQRQLDPLKQTLHTQVSGNLFRVRLGPYRSRAEANEVAERIRDVLEFKPVVVGR
ncbi:MAG: septal ring lytic transglycosylase RlpA family protein [Betaproteobacteria bacterium]|nr:septal ring lytic transglycosylase RlpA family protein [Betaproteobacteria bacterium]